MYNVNNIQGVYYIFGLNLGHVYGLILHDSEKTHFSYLVEDFMLPHIDLHKFFVRSISHQPA